MDVDAASEWFKHFPDPSGKYAALVSRAKTDWMKSIQEAEKIADAGERKISLEKQFQAWAESSPKTLEVELSKMADESKSLASIALLTWADLQDGNKLQIADRITLISNSGDSTPESPTRAAAWAADFAFEWGTTEPKEAASWWPKLAGGEMKEIVTYNIARSWVSIDLKSASHWIKNLPNGSGKLRAMLPAFEYWDDTLLSRKDWVESFQPGPAKDEGISRVASHLPPEEAINWVPQIENVMLREEVLFRILAKFMRTDIEAGIRAVRASSLPEDAKRRLLEMP